MRTNKSEIYLKTMLAIVLIFISIPLKKYPCETLQNSNNSILVKWTDVNLDIHFLHLTNRIHVIVVSIPAK